MSTLKTIVNYAYYIADVPPFSEEKAEGMTEFLNNKNTYTCFKNDLAWHLAFEYQLYMEDAEQFVAEWRKGL
jgi:hypothetical protein